MVRKVMLCFAIMVLCCAIGTTAHAQSYSTYDGTMSSTYVNYFRDIANNMSLTEHYVAFRSGQYEYIMAVGNLQYNNGVFTSQEEVKIYTFTQDGSYNSTYSYSVGTDYNFSVSVGNEIIYSDLGDYPNFIERGTKFEIVSAVFIGIGLLSLCIKRIFG